MSVLPYMAFVAFGANLAPSGSTVIASLSEAIRSLEDETCDVRVRSGFYRTPAFPPGSGPDFVNGVLEIATARSAQELLVHLAQAEAKAGRVRDARWSARHCDLDLLSFEDQVLPDPKTVRNWIALPLARQMEETPGELILPHPRIQDRAFVLVPLRQVAPGWRHPLTDVHIDEMIAALSPEDVAAVELISP